MTDTRTLPLEEVALLARNAGQTITAKCADLASTNSELMALLSAYRTDCENIIFADFAFAVARNIEAQLWNAHTHVNIRFRSQLKKLRESGTNLAVEKRKLLKQYLEYIKSSQLFYRQHVLRLDQKYGGIPVIRKEAQNWKHTEMKPASPAVTTRELRAKLLRSCYHTLIRLGDLSRYRASEIDEKSNWSPAVGFYSLAIEVNPDAPDAHNQMALIAGSENDHFRVLYYLYRALSTQEGLDFAASNLEREFKKVRVAWGKREPIHNRTTRDGNPAVRALIAWFIRLHSKCYAGEDFNEHDELESEVTSQLAVQLKERSLEGNLHKMVLINLSAEYFVRTQIESKKDSPDAIKPTTQRAYFFFLRLNVKTFFILLQILQSEFERLSEGGGREDVTARHGSSQHRPSDRISTVAKRIIPAIRLYSVWFLRSWDTLLGVSHIDGTALTDVDVRELFKAYTSTLTLIASVFPVEELPNVADDYLLEEDADTVGYAPLISPETCRNWYSNDNLKRKWSDSGVQRRHLNEEMLIRIRDLLVDGLEMAHTEQAPIDLVDRRFVYREAGLPSEQLASPEIKAATSPDVNFDIDDIPRQSGGPVLADDQASQGLAPSDTTSVALSKDTAMNRMVDSLVGGGGCGEDTLHPLQEVDEDLPPTPLAQTFEDTALVNAHSYGMTPIGARELVNAREGHSRRNTGVDPLQLSAIRKTPGSPSVRQISALPSLPNESGIWNPTYNGSNPGSPYLGDATGLTSRNSTTSLNAFHRGSHSRNPSTNSIAYGPTYDPWSSSSVTLPQTSSGAKPNGGGQNYAYLNGSPTPQYDPGMASSFLFGHAHSTWNNPAPGAERQKSSLGRTPPNGQGG